MKLFTKIAAKDEGFKAFFATFLVAVGLATLALVCKAIHLLAMVF